MLGSSRRDGFGTVTPYLLVADTDAYVTFLEGAFDGHVTYRTTGAAGGDHVEVQLGESRVMIGGGAPVREDAPANLFLYVEDVDAVHDRAVVAGASSEMEPTDGRFEAERAAAVVDPVGTRWFIARHEAVSEPLG